MRQKSLARNCGILQLLKLSNHHNTLQKPTADEVIFDKTTISWNRCYLSVSGSNCTSVVCRALLRLLDFRKASCIARRWCRCGYGTLDDCFLVRGLRSFQPRLALHSLKRTRLYWLHISMLRHLDLLMSAPA